MDATTHMIVAHYFLKSSGSQIGASIYSLLPIVDRSPAHFHRLYGHCLVNFPGLLQEGLTRIPLHIENIKNNSERNSAKTIDENNNRNNNLSDTRDVQIPLQNTSMHSSLTNKYFANRIDEEIRGMFKILLKAYGLTNNREILTVSTDRTSALLSLVSHIYIDIFNNPVQAFIPDNVYCSGQWNFWKKINFNSFRIEFYKQGNLEKFWNKIMVLSNRSNIDPAALVEAQIRRVAELSSSPIGNSLICQFLDHLDIKSESSASLDKATEFCLGFEQEFTESIINTLE